MQKYKELLYIFKKKVSIRKAVHKMRFQIRNEQFCKSSDPYNKGKRTVFQVYR